MIKVFQTEKEYKDYVSDGLKSKCYLGRNR